MLIYVYASFLAGLAGVVVSSRIGSGQPGLGVGYELDAIAAAVIGGTSLSAGGIGTVAGTIVGALIIGVLNNTLDLMNVSAFWQQIVKGCIIVGAVILDQLKNRGGSSIPLGLKQAFGDRGACGRVGVWACGRWGIVWCCGRVVV